MLIAIATLAIAIIWFLAGMGWGFFRPINNVEAVVQRGEIFDHSVFGDIDRHAKKDADGKTVVIVSKTSRSLLYSLLGIRWFGIPGIHKIGEVIINYPPQLKSPSKRDHAPNETAPGFSVRHNYILVVSEVEFQGGLNFNLEFSLDIGLIRPDIAWDRNGRFLDPLGQFLEGVIKQSAITINATDFIGKTQKVGTTSEQEKEIREKAEQYRIGMCKKCIELNSNTNQGDGDLVPIAELCGYEIVSIAYKDLAPSDENSRKRLNLLEEQSEAHILADLAEVEKITAKTNAESAAFGITIPGMAQVDVDKAAGMANVEVLQARKKALGQTLMAAELNAKAIENTGITTLVIGGDSKNGIPPVILPLPNESKPRKT